MAARVRAGPGRRGEHRSELHPSLHPCRALSSLRASGARCPLLPPRPLAAALLIRVSDTPHVLFARGADWLPLTTVNNTVQDSVHLAESTETA
jgi:hypothetical protein